MTLSRENIVACAREWIGTSFHLHGRVKKMREHKGGCDCLGLVMGVAKMLSILSALREDNNMHFPLTHYDTYLYGLTARKNSPDILKLFDRHFTACSEKKEGNIVLFDTDYGPYHMGIIGKIEEGVTSVIHTSYQTQKVVEHAMMHIPVGYYGYFGVT